MELKMFFSEVIPPYHIHLMILEKGAIQIILGGCSTKCHMNHNAFIAIVSMLLLSIDHVRINFKNCFFIKPTSREKNIFESKMLNRRESEKFYKSVTYFLNGP